MWKQKTPNLDPVLYQGSTVITDYLGWCLLYVQSAFGVGWSGTTALDAWNRSSKYNHTDSNPPRGVYVPLFYGGYLDSRGVDNGHTVIAVFNADGSGRAWTSPRTSKYTADVITFSNIENLHAQLRNGWARGLFYLGWSEAVGTHRVLEKVNEGSKNVATIQNQSNWKWRFNRLHHQLVRNGDMSDAVFKSIVGQDAWSVVESWSSHAESDKLIQYQVVGEKATKDNWAKQITDLQARVADLGTRPTKQQLDEVKAQAEKLASDLSVAKTEADTAKKEAEVARKEIEAEAKRQEALEGDAKGFWAMITKFIRELFNKGE